MSNARAIGSATLSFGLVSCPVKLFATGESASAVSFNLLCKKDGARLKQQYVCSKDGTVVEKDDQVKGYEFAKGQYVIFTPDELNALDEKANNSIALTEFVTLAQVDRVFIDKSYFLGPDKGSERPYGLLAAALVETNRAAIGQYAARGKQYLVAVRAIAANGTPMLVMEQLRYATEVRAAADVEIPAVTLKTPELELAVQLVEQYTTDTFRPEIYKDAVKERVLAQIQAKVDGKEITVEVTPEPKVQIADLMDALKASLKPVVAKSPSPSDEKKKSVTVKQEKKSAKKKPVKA